MRETSLIEISTCLFGNAQELISLTVVRGSLAGEVKNQQMFLRAHLLRCTCLSYQMPLIISYPFDLYYYSPTCQISDKGLGLVHASFVTMEALLFQVWPTKRPIDFAPILICF